MNKKAMWTEKYLKAAMVAIEKDKEKVRFFLNFYFT